MKTERDRRTLAFVLGVILLVLFILSSLYSRNHEYNTSDDNNVEYGEKIENKTLELKVIDNDTFIVTGSGKLSSMDLEYLLLKNNHRVSDVVNLIISGDISEIGFNAISAFGYLETLRIGDHVTHIHNGAIRRNPMLQYVYFPSGIVKMAKDALSACGQFMIVTSAEKLDLPINVTKDNLVVYGVDSLDKFEARYEEIDPSERIFDSAKLSANDPNAGTDPIVLHSGYIQYGPYMSIKQGTYQVSVYGDGFSTLEEGHIYILPNDENARVEKSDVRISDTLITYTIVVNRDLTRLELGINNTTTSTVRIEKLVVKSTEDSELPEVIEKYWW